MKMIEPKYGVLEYEDFCKESKCMTYNGISRLMSILEPSEAIKRDIEIIKIQCKQNCKYTAHEFYEWLKEKKYI